MKKFLVCLIFLLFILMTVVAESLSISTVDTSLYSVNDSLALYVSLLNEDGNPIVDALEGDFRLYEKEMETDEFTEIDSFSLNKTDKAQKSANFVFLIDNSGSMYYKIEGKYTRMDAVKRAMTIFLDSIPDDLDRKKLVTFNKYYEEQTGFVNTNETIRDSLTGIEKPPVIKGSTELYDALQQTVADLSQKGGRRFIILLSDGAQYSDSSIDKKPVLEQAIKQAVQENVVIFTIGFGKDVNKEKFEEELQSIATQTGGININALNRKALQEVYTRISNIIQQEYRLVYQGNNYKSEDRYIRLEYGTLSVNRQVCIETLYGKAAGKLFLFFLPLLLIVPLLLLLLNRLLSRRVTAPTLVGMDDGTKIITSSDVETIYIDNKTGKITLDKPDDFTKIIRKDDTYILEGKTTVNNKTTSDTRVLKAGDVIMTDAGTKIIYADTFSDMDEDKK